MHNPQATSPSIFDAPDWAAQADDILCPLCDYNLRGLHDPRCPECGYQFQWADLLDPSRWVHPYLFELHPNHSLASFWKTAFHGLRPGKFWKTIRADQPCVPILLVQYWLVIVGILTLAFVSGLALPGFGQFGSIRGVRGARAFIPLQVISLWPWVTYLCLSIFQVSIRRAKVKQSHVFRCTIYSWDICLWVALCMLCINIIWTFVPVILPSSISVILFLTPCAEALQQGWFWMLVELAFMYRLILAYSRYLRFPDVVVTVLLSQVVAVLFVLTSVTIIYAVTVF